MKISFLVTYFNQKDFVKQSLESILKIEKPDEWEIIVGDDGSSDGTIEEVESYIKKYPDNIRLYVMPREEGKKYDSVRRASANRLNILEHSTGDLFCTIDGDDFFCDTKFVADAIEVFENNAKISVVVFGFKYYSDGSFGEEFTLPFELNGKIVNKKEFLEKYYIHAGGCVYRKNFDADRIEYMKKLSFYDDNNIVINSLNYGEMYSVCRSVYAYRQTGQSIFTSMNELEQAILNVQGMDVDEKLVSDEMKESVYCRYSSSVALMYIWRKKIRNLFDEAKIEKYEDGCKTLSPSYCYNLLHYEEADKAKIKAVKKIINKSRKYAVKQFIKYCFKELGK